MRGQEIAMDAISHASTSRSSGIAWPGFGRQRRLWLGAAVLALAFIGVLILAAAGLRRTLPWVPSSRFTTGATAPVAGGATMPSTPTDGVLTLTIPLGAAADQEAGGRGHEMPPVISLHVGDRIVIRNDDNAPHMILYAWLRPGETSERTFTQPGSEVYSSGCGLHTAAILNFTTIFVSP
jgi:hypothetical protein